MLAPSDVAWCCGHWPCGQQVDERLVGVGRRVGRADASSAVAPGATRAVQVARMPRGIGTSIGVNETRDRRAGGRGEVLLDLGGVPVGAADAVGATSSPSPRRRAGAAWATLPAPEVPRGGDDDDVVGLDAARRRAPGRGRASTDGRVAAGDGDPGGAARARRAGRRRQLGQAVGPGAGVRRRRRTSVQAAGVGEPEVGAAVDDDDVVAAAGAASAAECAVRQGEEDDVVAGEHLGRGLGSRTRSASGAQVRVERPERLPGVGARRSARRSRRRGGRAAAAAARRRRTRWLRRLRPVTMCMTIHSIACSMHDQGSAQRRRPDRHAGAAGSGAVVRADRRGRRPAPASERGRCRPRRRDEAADHASSSPEHSASTRSVDLPRGRSTRCGRRARRIARGHRRCARRRATGRTRGCRARQPASCRPPVSRVEAPTCSRSTP